MSHAQKSTVLIEKKSESSTSWFEEGDHPANRGKRS